MPCCGSKASCRSSAERHKATALATPNPFILLNLILSCLAALQGAILLIAAKRADQISSELALHDYQTNVEADAIVKEIRELTRAVHGQVVGPNG